MSIVTISRGSFSRGKEVADKLAKKLQYECVSREIIVEACREFNIPEIKLIRALHDAPSVLERFQNGRERFLSYYNYALLKHVQQGNVVYHGLAGHYLLKNISHVLKVRIVADLEDRIRKEMQVENISESEARYLLRKDDDERRKWGIQVHGIDTWDSRLYDMVFHIGQISVDDVVDLLAITLQKETFKPTPESQEKLKKMVLTAKIQTMLVNSSPRAQVALKDGTAYVSNISDNIRAKTSPQRDRLHKQITEIEGVSEVIFKEPILATDNYINPFHNI